MALRPAAQAIRVGDVSAPASDSSGGVASKGGKTFDALGTLVAVLAESGPFPNRRRPT